MRHDMTVTMSGSYNMTWCYDIMTRLNKVACVRRDDMKHLRFLHQNSDTGESAGYCGDQGRTLLS